MYAPVSLSPNTHLSFLDKLSLPQYFRFLHLLDLLAVLKQNLSPNKATTRFVSCKYVPILVEPFDKTIRYSCTK